ncbi:MAG: hypothetical protein WCL39_02225 [Armatimonadota bacterium]
MVLALGIIGLLICGPLSIAAWVMAASDMPQMDSGAMDPTGRGLTQAGLICGIVGTLGWILIVFALLANT